MAKKSEKQNEDAPVVVEQHNKIVDRSLVTEMKDSYIDYAMSVITDRALPDVRDGLKPVHRRILFSMHQLGLTASAKFSKSAKVVGEVMGNYHPHGDMAIYNSLVNLAQDFSTRYPLIWGQGNFGNIDGDSPAAMRYTESRMAKISAELLRDIEKNTVDTRPNYDGTKKEPTVLPTAVPNLLLNGTLGIAVGMATNIPPHNLREVLDATVHLLDNPEASNNDLNQFIKGPDFPTGGIMFSEADIKAAYAHGRGGVVVRGEAEVVEEKAGLSRIIITSIPFRVNKSDLIISVADLVRDKKIEGIKDIRDESTKDIRIVIDLKNGAYPENVLNFLYKHTQLESTFHFNMVALVNGVPQTLSLHSFLEEFIGHRKVIIRRRTEFDLAKAKDEEHILLGLKKALDHIDEIIALIKKSKDRQTAHLGLMKEFKFSDRQAFAILEMKLHKLSALDRKKIEEDLKKIQEFIKECEEILKSAKKVISIIKDELAFIREKYGDDRRTKVVKHGTKDFSLEDIIPNKETVLVLTSGGYIKRTDPEEYRKQKRGGVGVMDLNTKEEDFITHFLNTSTHNDLLFFTDKGKAYQIKAYDIPEGKRATRGKSIKNFLSIADEEKITSILSMPKEIKKGGELSLFLVTKSGTGKKVSAENFHDVRRSGIIAIRLDVGDELVSASFVQKSDSIMVVSSDGQSIRFDESDVREMGRSAGGVRVIRLDKNVHVVGADTIGKDVREAQVFVVSANGYGKKTEIGEFKIQGRGGSGIKCVKVTDKTGDLISARIVTTENEEAVAISKKSQVIRCDLNEIPSLGRDTQGVRVMKLREGDSLASVITL